MKIAETEEKHVKIIRAVTFSFITISAIAVSLVVYLVARKFDTDAFESEYEYFVESIQADVVWEVKYNMALLQQLSSTITSEIVASNQTAPFITMPNFEVTGGFTDGMGGIMAVVFAPLLYTTTTTTTTTASSSSSSTGGSGGSAGSLIEQWESYSVQNQGWLKESARLKVQHTNHLRPLEGTHQDHETDLRQTTLVDRQSAIDDDDDDDENERHNNNNNNNNNGNVVVVAPLWQSSPPEASIVNEAGVVVVGDLFDWIFAPGEEYRKKEPHTFIMERVFADFDTDTTKSEPIGFVLGLSSYRHLFERILPEGRAKGIYCVLEGTTEACGGTGTTATGTITYLIDGPEAVFVGYGDLHNKEMDEYEATIHRLELYDTITESVCVHDLHIYPTPEFKAAYTTNKALVYTSVVVLAFAVTTFCFLIYERTTVMFADIAGFTAWSSTREPEQVFHLLETVYGAMDQIAMRRGVFKVETVGDCYVAVCGLPEPREDHVVSMARFARDCQLRMASLSQQLEIALGPDTADLSFRIGIHSGPVTGGVLRGQNARFQLFGDTMNQASRMESTGVRGRIQMSATTAQLLIDRGKGKWVEKRPEKVNVKGKGLQETYFFKQTSGKRDAASVASGSETETEQSDLQQQQQSPASTLMLSGLSSKTQRLIRWNTEVLSRRIKSLLQYRENSFEVEMSQKVADQLQRHVLEIACMYRDNPFHNYEHASHVTLSMEKMMSRVERINEKIGEHSLNRYTNDIATDPLAQFAVVYSALIHDVDHTGVSNGQLVKEKNNIAVQYHGKSPAENHSIHVAWTTLMKPEYHDLMQCLCPSASEKDRFRRLVINAVLATDIFDEDLKESRNYRWNQVFGEAAESDTVVKNRKDVDALRVMIVLEHLIQASDVAHTMQHWHVYIKWNERLFHELNDAYENGRMGKDPADFWYEGELGFFDHYVIPLARKLRECAVFGVSCDELLNYAETNRNEWEAKGRDIVREYALRFKRHEDDSVSASTNTSEVNLSHKNSNANSATAGKEFTSVRIPAATAA
eukprot:jgi/Psemu1/243039/estExt_Genewise1.C_3250021